ncbi:hypothetical protein SUZIE_137925 [Sciurus carolinensis]|uniref:Uncharacterized protein n=1 Tax=Sciurus carolinensis TaxID=30640 RepID=A0AA41SX96_SCICA|nr:hypothetical protein [Sciurus carolinensis]
MATAGISRSGGRKRPPPGFGLRKQNLIPLSGEQNGRKATTRLERCVPRSPSNHFTFRGTTLPAGEPREPKGPGIRPALAPRGLGARRSRGAQRSAAGSIPGHRRSAHCANPAGPTRPARPLLLEPGRRTWTLRVSPGAGIQRPAPPPRPLLRPPGFCPQSWWLP